MAEVPQYRQWCFNGVRLGGGRASHSGDGCGRCCCPSHAGVHGVHLAGGRSAPGLGKPLGLPAAAGVCQERVGVVSWPAIAGGDSGGHSVGTRQEK